jgi:hypothetical protein
MILVSGDQHDARFFVFRNPMTPPVPLSPSPQCSTLAFGTQLELARGVV